MKETIRTLVKECPVLMKSHDKKGRTRAVVSVSITPEKTEEFYAALATLKRHHEDPFIQAAPLIVETIIEAARRIQQDADQEKSR